MSQFWLNDPTQLYKLNTSNKLNLLSSIAIIVFISITIIKKDSGYFIWLVAILLVIIVYYSTTVSKSSFDNPKSNQLSNPISNVYDTGVYLVRDTTSNQSGLNNRIYTNNSDNFNKGDIIALSVNGSVIETNIIADILVTTDASVPMIVLLNDLKNSYLAKVTKVMKAANSTPNLISPPDPTMSIQNAGSGTSDPDVLALQRFPKSGLTNLNRYDWNLELSTYGGLQPGESPNYKYDGQPYGPLKCRETTLLNPMGTINPMEYDAEPGMYGTCNVQEGRNNINMTENQEATVSQRVDDLLFHKGNSQYMFSPMPVDTVPNDQEAFAHFCYRGPTNLVNPKYASIFVNDPEKFKLVSKLARATGTENGGGGGH